MGDFPEVEAEQLHNLIPNGFYLWCLLAPLAFFGSRYPLGKFAMILVEAQASRVLSRSDEVEGVMDDLPSKFAVANEARSRAFLPPLMGGCRP